MKLLLNLETSTTVCSAALHEDGNVLACIEMHVPQTASSRLAVMIDDLFEIAAVDRNSLAGVGVSAGPGSFTGLRIGVATAKGICYALKLPLLSVNTLELMGYQLSSGNPQNAMLCPMLDARRMEVYSMLLDSNLNILEATEARVISEDSYREWLDRGPVIFFGDGAAKCKDKITHANAWFVDGVIPSAAKLGELSYRKFQKNEFEDLASYEPYYLKDFLIGKPKSV